MSLRPLINTTIFLFALGCLGIEVMTDNVAFWMIGIILLVAFWFRMFDLENHLQEQAHDIN